MCTWTVPYWCFGHLRPWVICLSSQATLQVFLLHSRGGWSHRIRCHYHQGCYDTWYSPFLSTFSSGLSRSMIGFTRRDVILTFFFTIFIIDDVCAKVWLLLSLQSAWSNVTKSYTGIGASFINNSRFGLLLWGGVVFVVLNLVVFKILWADDNWFPSIIKYYNILCTNYN